MNKISILVISICLISFSRSQQEQYYGIEECPGIDNSRYLQSMSLTLNRTPTQGIPTIGTLTTTPKKSYYVSYTKVEVFLKGFKVYEGKTETDKSYKGGVTEVEEINMDTQLAPTGLFTIKTTAINEFGDVILCFSIWMQIQKKVSLPLIV